MKTVITFGTFDLLHYVITKRCIMQNRLEDDEIETNGVFDARQDLSSIGL